MNVKLAAAAKLEEAAGMIRQFGHAKYDLVDRHGRLCAMGAINMAFHGCERFPTEILMHGLRSAPPAYRTAVLALGDSLGEEEFSGAVIPDWNNHPERTGNEVIAQMQSVAAVLRAQARASLPVTEAV